MKFKVKSEYKLLFLQKDKNTLTTFFAFNRRYVFLDVIYLIAVLVYKWVIFSFFIINV